MNSSIVNFFPNISQTTPSTHHSPSPLWMIFPFTCSIQLTWSVQLENTIPNYTSCPTTHLFPSDHEVQSRPNLGTPISALALFVLIQCSNLFLFSSFPFVAYIAGILETCFDFASALVNFLSCLVPKGVMNSC